MLTTEYTRTRLSIAIRTAPMSTSLTQARALLEVLFVESVRSLTIIYVADVRFAVLYQFRLTIDARLAPVHGPTASPICYIIAPTENINYRLRHRIRAFTANSFLGYRTQKFVSQAKRSQVHCYGKIQGSPGHPRPLYALLKRRVFLNHRPFTHLSQLVAEVSCLM